VRDLVRDAKYECPWARSSKTRELTAQFAAVYAALKPYSDTREDTALARHRAKRQHTVQKPLNHIKHYA